jgi:hypothetical protein
MMEEAATEYRRGQLLEAVAEFDDENHGEVL